MTDTLEDRSPLIPMRRIGVIHQLAGMQTSIDGDDWRALLDLRNGTPVYVASATGPEAVSGWKLVPVEPTPEMLKAASDELGYCDEDRNDPETDMDHRTAYAAMLEAAPPMLSPAYAVAGWQPMNTAPQDGTEIVILWRAYEDDKLKAQNVCWQEDSSYTDENGERHAHPAGFYGIQGGLFVYGKCWMPLPTDEAACASAEKSNQPRYKTVADWSP